MYLRSLGIQFDGINVHTKVAENPQDLVKMGIHCLTRLLQSQMVFVRVLMLHLNNSVTTLRSIRNATVLSVKLKLFDIREI